jgi:hypothetical protein
MGHHHVNGNRQRSPSNARHNPPHSEPRRSFSAILQNTEFSPSPSRSNPYAVPKAANHVIITAIGRGILAVQNLAVTTYIFRDADLANNLLGLVPFANFGCTTIFKLKTFPILQKDGTAPVLTDRRPRASSLWTVALNALHMTHSSDGILLPASQAFMSRPT